MDRWCEACKVDVKYGTVFNHIVTDKHKINFDKLKKGRNTNIRDGQNGILYTTQEQREYKQDYHRKHKDETVYCNYCKQTLKKFSYSSHKQTQIHKDNIWYLNHKNKV
jgi:hypothetical protein